jgi:pimeloyl-ACP methyl ester carboxylesterase
VTRTQNCVVRLAWDHMVLSMRSANRGSYVLVMTVTIERQRLLENMPVTERRIELAGMSTAVLEAGAGPPMVLLHGPGAHAAAWLPAIPGLAATHRVIAPDLPGQGATAAADGPLDVARVFSWLDALIDGTCATPPVLVGQLTGGAIAARFAADTPGRVKALVLVVPFGLAPFAPAPAFAAALTGYLSDPTGPSHDTLWRHCVRDLDDVRSRLGDRWKAMRAYNIALTGTPAAADAMQELLALFAMPTIPDEVLTRIAVPTTLVWGRQDAIVPVSVGTAAAARYGWPIRVLDNTGNEPAIEDPGAFVTAVTS